MYCKEASLSRAPKPLGQICRHTRRVGCENGPPLNKDGKRELPNFDDAVDSGDDDSDS